MLTIRFADQAPSAAEAVAYPILGGQLPGRLLALDGTQALRHAAEAQRFDAEAAAIVEAFVADGGSVRRLFAVGLGTGGAGEGAAAEKVGAALVARLETSGLKRLTVDLTDAGLSDPAEAAARIAFGATLRAWRYDVHRTKQASTQKPTLAELVIVGGGAGADTAWARHSAVAEGMALTRELVTEPANIIYPESFVERVRAAMPEGVVVEVLDDAAMRELGMGALLGVSQGSAREARLLALRWNGGAEGEAPVAFVGKGVTFDTGGISIKPAGGMEDMKWDMGGAGAVAGAMLTLARRGARANIIGVCGLVENMPDGLAQRPGDVVTSMSGQTIEVINTDAEGRLVLCDAITWVQRTHKPKTIVDLATLTGAMIITLGHEYGGIFANDDALADGLLAAARDAGEPLWRLPMGDPYDKLIDSAIADMKNVGPREAGSISAAQFIKRFVDEGVAWAHLDIAGMVWSSKGSSLMAKGATGFGVRLIDRYVADTLEA
ncbi:leucyl aminopeptidase [Sphingomonas jatrophae]|uniref:Probable cytosol aminopeptidase n=1 Tax=Sphingomonas jatrophae TaxID=1166337 RepID=A0A1I6L589_9SPHN|nr:leucyl aminopeptidase [Sphingomonas jatrophae]